MVSSSSYLRMPRRPLSVPPWSAILAVRSVRTSQNTEYRQICKRVCAAWEGCDMPDEVFRMTVGVTDAERLLIDGVWVDTLRRNRWRRRGWRLLHRLRAHPSPDPLPKRRGNGVRASCFAI